MQYKKEKKTWKSYCFRIQFRRKTIIKLHIHLNIHRKIYTGIGFDKDILNIFDVSKLELKKSYLTKTIS